MSKFKSKLFRLLSFIYPITIKTYESALSGKLELTYEYGRLVVNTAVANYSYGSLHEVFRQVLKRFDFNSQPKKILILGFGAGSIANILVKEYQVKAEIHGVELDPVMLELYLKYFKLDELNQDNLQLFIEDAIQYLQKHADRYDCILVDVFANLNVPETLLNDEFIRLLSEHSTSDGQIAMNTMLDESHPFVQQWFEVFGDKAKLEKYDVSNLVLFRLGA